MKLFGFEITRTRPTEQKGIGYASPGEAIFADHDAYVYAKETYKENVFAFGCIDKVAKAVSSVAWGLYTKKADGGIELANQHPSSNILSRPNPDESFSFLMYRATAYLMIAGNTYFHRSRPMSGPNRRYAKELDLFRPDRMKVIIDQDKNTLKGFQWKIGTHTEFFPIDQVTGQAEVMQVKLFDPLNDWYGMGNSKPAARDIDSSNDATEWNKSLLQNKGQPGMLYMFEDALGDNQFNRLKQQLRDEYSGPKNAGKSMILEGARDAKPFGLTPAEFDFIESNRELARKIALSYGVPPMLLGIPGDNTYSNYREARLAFWEDTVIFYLNLFKGELNNWLFGTENIYMDYNLDDVPALAPRREILWNNAQTSDFLTINQKLEMVGFEGVGDAGDIVLVPANMIPLDMAVSMEEPVEEEKPTEEEPEEDEEEKAFQDLLDMGYDEEQACRFLGLPYEDQYV